MNPQAEHIRASYRGSGKLKGRRGWPIPSTGTTSSWCITALALLKRTGHAQYEHWYRMI